MSAHHPEGTLAQTDHPRGLGSALTHANITTDYSESLLEFITPATDSIESLIEQLGDIHRHAIHHLGMSGSGRSPCLASSATRRAFAWPSTAAPTSGA